MSFQLYLYGPGQGPIPSSFEAAQQRLEKLPRLYFEPDGSFVWSPNGISKEETGRVFGMLYDAVGLIQYCELRGDCSVDQWRTLCAAICGSGEAVLEVLLLPEQELQDLQRFEADLDSPS